MASYSINVFDDGSGNFTAEIMRSPSTNASGGSGVAIPHYQDTAQDGGTFRGGPFTVTGASNATPIVITVASTGSMAVNDVVTVQGALGNTGANGTWQVSAVTATTFTLKDSAGNAAWTSGGTAYVLRPSKLLSGVIEAAKRAILDDRSLNG